MMEKHQTSGQNLQGRGGWGTLLPILDSFALLFDLICLFLCSEPHNENNSSNSHEGSSSFLTPAARLHVPVSCTR